MTDAPVRRERMTGSWVFRPGVRSFAVQFLLLALLGLAGWVLFSTARHNIVTQGIPLGFDFFRLESGFSISQTLIPFSEANSYARAFLVGLLNTLLVSLLGVLFATILGFLIGIGRLSQNWIVARLCGGYVEVLRNLPLLFQILFWYLAVLAALPVPRQSFSIFDEIFVNNRGIFIPKPVFGEGIGIVLSLAAIGIVGAIAASSFARRRRIATGHKTSVWPANVAAIVLLPLFFFLYLGVTVTVDHPVLKGFNFNGGIRLIPEFLALLIALSTYTASFIAEIVRAGSDRFGAQCIVVAIDARKKGDG